LQGQTVTQAWAVLHETPASPCLKTSLATQAVPYGTAVTQARSLLRNPLHRSKTKPNLMLLDSIRTQLDSLSKSEKKVALAV
jgi:hypothetical protein